MTEVIESRVVTDPAVMGGEPVLEGTRVPAENVLAEIKAGRTPREIFGLYPSLPLDALETCLAWDRARRSA